LYEKPVSAESVVPAQLYRQACDGGHRLGCYNLGVSYYRGEGVRLSHTIAAGLFGQACDAGIALGSFNLGNLHKKGEGAARDQTQAVAYWRKAPKLDRKLAAARHNLNIFRQVP
jgi:TPR repeat protein